MHILENNQLRVLITAKGAELRSIYNKITAQELLWQADPMFWGKSSPILFPIVGALKEESYFFDGNKYHLSRHGFARDYEFMIEKLNDIQLQCTLNSSEETKYIYPFDFKLVLLYTLVEDRLEVNYKVENTSGTNKMFFSLGAHPAFNVGKTSDEFSEYQLVFNQDDELITYTLNNNLLQEKEEIIMLEGKTLPLNYKLFEKDALVIKQLKSNAISLVHQTKGKLFDFNFQNLPYFGIWTVQKSNFICLEPWAGIADFESHNQQLKDKLGIIQLEPNKIWTASWSIKTNNK